MELVIKSFNILYKLLCTVQQPDPQCTLTLLSQRPFVHVANAVIQSRRIEIITQKHQQRKSLSELFTSSQRL